MAVPETSFELYEYQNDYWVLVERFAGREREAALYLARQIEQRNRRAWLKIVKSAFNPDSGAWDELVVHRSAALQAHEAKHGSIETIDHYVVYQLAGGKWLEVREFSNAGNELQGFIGALKRTPPPSAMRVVKETRTRGGKAVGRQILYETTPPAIAMTAPPLPGEDRLPTLPTLPPLSRAGQGASAEETAVVWRFFSILIIAMLIGAMCAGALMLVATVAFPRGFADADMFRYALVGVFAGGSMLAYFSLAAAFDVSASRVVAAFSEVDVSASQPRVMLLGPTRQVTPVLPDLPPMQDGPPIPEAGAGANPAADPATAHPAAAPDEPPIDWLIEELEAPPPPKPAKAAEEAKPAHWEPTVTQDMADAEAGFQSYVPIPGSTPPPPPREIAEDRATAEMLSAVEASRSLLSLMGHVVGKLKDQVTTRDVVADRFLGLIAVGAVRELTLGGEVGSGQRLPLLQSIGFISASAADGIARWCLEGSGSMSVPAYGRAVALGEALMAAMMNQPDDLSSMAALAGELGDFRAAMAEVSEIHRRLLIAVLPGAGEEPLDLRLGVEMRRRPGQVNPLAVDGQGANAVLRYWTTGAEAAYLMTTTVARRVREGELAGQGIGLAECDAVVVAGRFNALGDDLALDAARASRNLGGMPVIASLAEGGRVAYAALNPERLGQAPMPAPFSPLT
jgi:hypothetical protein